MTGNKNLAAAKKAKNDEFYTLREDIEAELQYYMKHFKGKVVYCNCDDPDKSEFWKFFIRMFESWGLKKLIATYYETDEHSCSYKLETISGTEFTKMPLHCNGDFRSAACIELLKEADIMVTNPPFSLFREYIIQLAKYKKDFLIIGNMNAITYKEFFPLLKEGGAWIGCTHPKKFLQPDGTIKSFGNIMWFTNLDIEKRHKPLDLRGGGYYDNESKYPRYDNYDAIECGKVCDIPEDYYEYMDVPITFMDKHCPEQFEIIGATESEGKGFSNGLFREGYSVTQPMINGKRIYKRLFIRRRM